jgi:hypothetical protein
MCDSCSVTVKIEAASHPEKRRNFFWEPPLLAENLAP